MTTTERISVRVADEVWVATALLHREKSEQSDFSVSEILERAKTEAVSEELRPGVYVHIVQHCVAGRAPSPGRYRMLVETAKNRRRLFRAGDSFHPARDGSKTTPDRDELPAKYHKLLDWYWSDYARTVAATAESDPLLELCGSGKRLWADEHADEYVRHLREGWE